MEIAEQLRCLFSGNIEERNGSYMIEVPEQELRLGDLQADETYCVAVLPPPETNETNNTDAEPQPEQAPQTPPVEEGEQRTVEIEDIGRVAEPFRLCSLPIGISTYRTSATLLEGRALSARQLEGVSDQQPVNTTVDSIRL